MNIKIVKVGYLEENCYILEQNDEVIIIDPGDEFEKIESQIQKKVIGIVITHYHFDHIGALEECRKKYNSQVYDVTNLKEGLNSIGNFSFEVIYTPGHKDDAISIYFKDENILFCGDFIFKNGIGRCDLETGDFNKMKKSINKILNYDKNMIIYPGHGDKTSLKDETRFLESII